MKIAREIARTEPFAGWLKREVFPGPEVTDDEQLSELLRKAHHTVYHPAGTARMGTDELAVVDPALRVRGVPRLRVADISVIPSIVSGNTNAPAIMIGERCADFILRP